MSTLYHISRTTGKPAKCTASVRACPNGGMHFTSEAEALLNAPRVVSVEPTAKVRKLGFTKVEVVDHIVSDNGTGGVSDKIPAVDFAANAAYADMLKGVNISDVRGTLPYVDDVGRFVKRGEMVARVEELERTQRGWFSTNHLREQLYRADATHLRAMKQQWAKANAAYRAEHGPAARPDFSTMIADYEQQVAAAKIKRDTTEDSIPLSLHGFFGVKKNKQARTPSAVELDRGDVVPAAAIGEFVGSVATKARTGLREQRAFLKEEIAEFFNRG